MIQEVQHLSFLRDANLTLFDPTLALAQDYNWQMKP